MRMLYAGELALVSGGDVAPTCTVVAVTITGSNGNSTTVYSTVCACPEGSTLETSTSGNTVKATCRE